MQTCGASCASSAASAPGSTGAADGWMAGWLDDGWHEVQSAGAVHGVLASWLAGLDAGVDPNVAERAVVIMAGGRAPLRDDCS